MLPIDILLVDDHHLVLDGMRALLAEEPLFNVVGEARTGKEAVEMAAELKPRIVIMDISMPDMDGIEATQLIRKNKRLSKTLVLVVSMYSNREFVDELLAVGASGYLLKNTGRAELHEAIMVVHTGGRYLCKAVQDTVDAALAATPIGTYRAPVTVTKREKEIMKLVAAQKTNGEIATILGLSVLTVETHRKNIGHKIGLHTTAGLVRYAVERGWIMES
jgi:two-component system, NarL family, nitrate/nitrite response regulator NarL